MGAHIVYAAQEVVWDEDLEHEDEAEHEDDDCVHVGCGEGGLQPTNGRIHHHSNWDQEAHGCTGTHQMSSHNTLVTPNTALPVHIDA